MARHVRDLRLAFEAMAAPDSRDAWFVPAPLRGPEVVKRVAVVLDPAGEGINAAVAAGVHKAADALRDAGYEVEEAEPPLVAEARDTWANLVLTELNLTLYPLLRGIASADSLRFLEAAFEAVPPLDYVGYIGALARRDGIARAWSEFQARYPLILGPVGTEPPFPATYDTQGPSAVGELLRRLRFVVTGNLLGLPAVAIPVGVTHGLPQGVQIYGARYREDLCLDAGEAIEQRLSVVTPIDPQ
jgi:amidase